MDKKTNVLNIINSNSKNHHSKQSKSPEQNIGSHNNVAANCLDMSGRRLLCSTREVCIPK